MRIVAGRYGGRRLQAPKGRNVRPTSDKIRGAIFNALQSRIAFEGLNVLDGFCGTGALGLEALSRGAVHCTFVDKSAASIAALRTNVDSLSLQDAVQIMKCDLTKLQTRAEGVSPVDLVFLDPPYNQDLLPSALVALDQGRWLSDQAMFVLETEKSWDWPKIANYTLQSEKIYGETKILFLEYNPATK